MALLHDHGVYVNSDRTEKYFINKDSSTNTALKRFRQRTNYTTSLEPPETGQFLNNTLRTLEKH